MKQGKGGRGNRGDQQVVRGGGGGRGRGVLEEAEEDLTVIFIFSCPRPPEATTKKIAKCAIIDIIWIITKKISLKYRTDGTRICEIQVLSELKTNLEIIVRNFPTHTISDQISQTNLIQRVSLEINQN